MCEQIDNCSNKRNSYAASLKHRAARQLGKFRKEEDGAVVAFTLFVFVLFLAMGGIGVDVMRHEMERANLQSTLDSAVLAGASTTDTATAKATVEDYFAKSSMSEYLNEISEDDIEVTRSTARVTASADMTLQTYLMKFAGVDTLSTGGGSTAEKHIPKLEIVMVLDTSQSMKDSNKIENLRSAAKNFISEVMGPGNEQTANVVISVVPFNTSVTPSRELYNTLAVSETHGYSTCLYFESNDYNHASLGTGNHGLSEGSPVKQQLYTSIDGGYWDLNPETSSCNTNPAFNIFPYSISESDLHSMIDGLVLSTGAMTDQETSTDQGVKWGSAMLHPTFREVSTDLLLDAEQFPPLNPLVAPHPVDYDDPDTLKVLILLGDGENTTTYYFDKSNPEFRGANSDVYLIEAQNQELTGGYYKKNRDQLHTAEAARSKCGDPKYVCLYKPVGSKYSAHYIHDATPDADGHDYFNLDHNADEGAASPWMDQATWDAMIRGDDPEIVVENVTRLDWEYVWGLISPKAYGEITENWAAYNDYMYSEQITGAMKDERMGRVCDASKTMGAIHFSIGYMVNGTAEARLRNCASSNAHYFSAEAESLNGVLNNIALNIQNLRLTQ